MRKAQRFRFATSVTLLCFLWMLIWPGIALAQKAPEQNSSSPGLLASLFRHEKAPSISREAKRMAVLNQILNNALFRLQRLLQQVEQGKPGSASLVENKVRSLKGVVSALNAHLTWMEENLSRLESKGIVSPQKFREAEGKIEKAKAPMENLLAQLSGISSTKSDSESRAVAAQALQTLQSFLQTNNPLAQQLPSPKEFKLPNRTGFDLVQLQDAPDAQEIIQEEENDPSPPTEDTEAVHDPLKPGPPTPADLQSTPDAQITPEIQAQASSLGNDPAKMLSYVHDHFFFEPYFGAEKGSQETFFSMGGNDTDQASLLIALLRSAGIPARYETGVAVTKLDEAANWLDVSYLPEAFVVLHSNGIPASYTHRGRHPSLIFQHTWVIAFLHNRWVRIDPSFKQHQIYAGVNPLGLSGFDSNTFQSDAENGATVNAQSSYFTNVNFAVANQYAQQISNNLVNIVDTQYPNYTMGQLFGGKAIIPADLAKLERELPDSGKPSTLPYRVKKLLSISSDVPSSAHFTVSFSVSRISFTANVEDVVNKKVWIEYQPATPQDAAIIQAAGGIYNVIPAYIVNMVPVLKIEDQVVGTGSPIPLGYSEVFSSRFSGPNLFSDFNYRVLFTGANYVIGLDAQRGFINPNLGQRIGQARTAVSSGTITDATTSDVLFATAKAYFGFIDIQNENAAKFTNIVWSRNGPAEAVMAQDVSVLSAYGLPYQILPGGYSIDVKRDVVSPFSKVGDPTIAIEWLVTTGGMGSAEEHLINEQVHQTPSVSTIKILQLASQTGVPIYIITPDNLYQILPALQIDPGIEGLIIQFVSQGWFAIIPQTNITLNQWTGTGFAVVDPSTGGSGYFIAGGIGNQLQISNGGATSTSTPQLLGDTSLDPTIQSSLDNQEQTSLDANAKTTKQPPNSAAIQFKKSERDNDYLWGGIATLAGVVMFAGPGLAKLAGGIMLFAAGVVFGMGIKKSLDADRESKS